MGKVVAYKMVKGDKDDVLIECGKKSFRMSDIAAKILNRIRKVASDYLGQEVKRAVVTVPAYFTDRQRQAVKDAGKLIDLEVVRIINEPTSASLAYGFGKNLTEKIIIYDLGGGTFDVSIIEIRGNVFEVKSTGGDIFLGGIDFDNVMIHYVLEDFAKKHAVDLSSDPVAMQRIKDLAEKVKIDLSSRAEVPFNIPFITMTSQGMPLNIEMTFTRKKLEALTGDLIDRTLKIVAKVLVDSGFSTRDIDQVMLVGGQTRMPMVQDRLTKFFGKVPSKAVHPDEAVAIGAAIYGHSLEDNSPAKVQLLDVIPMAIGLEKAGGDFHMIFPRNAPIPNAKQLTATTSIDSQANLAMRIFQGDDPKVAKDELLGEFNFTGIRPEKAGKVRVEITFDVNVEGILTMSAKDPDTGASMKTTVRVTSS